MVDQLHQRAVGIVAIEAARAVAMRLRALCNRYARAHQLVVPAINIRHVVNYEAYVIQSRPLLRGARRAVGGVRFCVRMSVARW